MTVAFVIEPPVHRVKRLQQQAAKHDWSLVDLRYNKWCVQSNTEQNQDDLEHKLRKKFRSTITQRANCNIARFPKGRGYAVLVLGDTTREAVDDAKEALGLKHWTVVAPNGTHHQSTLLCVSKWEVPDIPNLKASLDEHGVLASSIWEVGSCHPQ